jgi:hypothetical protein
MLLAAGIGTAGTATARTMPQSSFTSSGGIRDWRADGNQALFIQAPNGKWFRAELMSPCIDLPFAEDIGLITRPAGRFDKFSSIMVKNRTCQVRSLVASEGPSRKNAAQ